MLHAIEYFAKPLKIVRNDMYLDQGMCKSIVTMSLSRTVSEIFIDK